MDSDVGIVKRIQDRFDTREGDDGAENVAPSTEPLLRVLYAAYNRRDADALLLHLGPDVDWPDGEDRLHGREQVRDYWLEQWSRIHTHDTITSITQLAAGHWVVCIDQVVRGLDGSVLSIGRFEHRHRIEGGLVRRLDIQAV